MYTHRTVGRVWLESRMRCTSGVSVSANSRPPTLAMHARESPCACGGVGVCVVRTSESGVVRIATVGPPASAMHARESPRASQPRQRQRQGPCVSSRPARVGDARQGEPVRVRVSAVGPPALAMHARESPSGSVCQQSARPRRRCTAGRAPARARASACARERPRACAPAWTQTCVQVCVRAKGRGP